MKDKTHISQPTEKSTVQRASGNIRERETLTSTAVRQEHMLQRKAGITVTSLVGQASFRRVWEDAN